jgi:hypothetical protein
MVNLESRWVEIDVVGETTKKRYFGRIELKPFLTHREKAEAVKLAEKYMIGIEVSLEFRSFLTTLAFLSLHIVNLDAESKGWWGEDGLSLLDESPIYATTEALKKLQFPEEAKKELDAGEK